jgi:hypothetical protein
MAVASAAGLLAWKLRHAQEVFDRIVGQADPAVDEVARRRLARTSAAHRVTTHLPHMAAQSRRHH